MRIKNQGIVCGLADSLQNGGFASIGFTDYEDTKWDALLSNLRSFVHAFAWLEGRYFEQRISRCLTSVMVSGERLSPRILGYVACYVAGYGPCHIAAAAAAQRREAEPP